MKGIAFVLMLLATSNVAAAEGYFGVKFSAVTVTRYMIRQLGLPTEARNSDAFGLLAGYHLNRYLACEASVAYYDGVNAGNRFLSLVWTANLVGTIPLAQDYLLYADAGIANASPGMYGMSMTAGGTNAFGGTYGFGLMIKSYEKGPDVNYVRISVEHMPMGNFPNGRQTDVTYQILVTQSFF